MNVDAWCGLAADPRVQAKISSDPALPYYRLLIEHFAARNPLSWDDAVIGLHIVYGSMKSSLDLSLPADLNSTGRSRVVRLLNDARLRSLTICELKDLKDRFCNHSMVGVSKLLHFINPSCCPSWGTEVAHAWYAPLPASFQKYEDPEEYRSYANQIVVWSISPITAGSRSTVRGVTPDLAAVSDLRLIELVLFHS